MKLRVELDGEEYTLALDETKNENGSQAAYALSGAMNASGVASIAEVKPGVFSVLLGSKSFVVHVATKGAEVEVWTGNERHVLSLADTRDQAAGRKSTAAAGPLEMRALMPGKIIKLLASTGDVVEAGQGVVVVEAMKMQNEMKAPKNGVVSKILVAEGAAVAPGETLVVIE